ncbi:MAG: 50S ribosomal protein L31 [Candidatus Wildermuthbacteria bacterium RIFCSPLOWO2_02_FULL_47_9c]|uniref:Large ribosomal subunit protein bL31 n=1 Tax=Candidatus Wildermuthbacteria bacterium RIFCSPLOWO2_02_FULL_47_9c TaxID=1802466 RepID=A0A1G2RVJ2_9BACT|nr:MAG: 50S ribosomal protein L31 [Parcubacteria group bacterium GW2011_GWA2_50_10]OHA61213.1 MAG: 50S ribosomal protein L31 [Candidatus Wildermuthbacteria bacterium GWA1_49_26]OHA65670.1 MAG: 50S ribosomal protein L31 [Candidatus Wildermuthbacteria bacterium RIFCSPHIGHO2_01_FULL_50_47]OHA69405.1 MAG: 50S ribosomal protein L31 [Candidatus Wildermuthbacteria bacterium RIFCSPHIGHO2_02_FULL_49_17]OHA71610.1 MAG: 50S ribosomal protein L31 [Candidatus Wildermuthbacteria bacterium RIFCSPHIGHO2_12_FUL
MKKDIHPTYYPKAKVACACGNTFIVGSTQPTLEVEVCSACHPFYTGQDKVMDKVGRIQKFRERLAQKREAPKTRTRGKARVITKKPVRQAQGKKA